MKQRCLNNLFKFFKHYKFREFIRIDLFINYTGFSSSSLFLSLHLNVMFYSFTLAFSTTVPTGFREPNKLNINYLHVYPTCNILPSRILEPVSKYTLPVCNKPYFLFMQFVSSATVSTFRSHYKKRHNN